MTELDQHEELAYEKWISGVDEICMFNLDQPLIRRTVDGFLSVNFDPKVQINNFLKFLTQ